MSKKTKRKKLIYNICIGILGVIFVGCGIYLAKYYYDTSKSEKRFDELESMIIEEASEENYDNTNSENNENTDKENSDKTIEYVEINGVFVQKKFSKLYEANPDFIGWLKIEGTDINYPVMQSLYDEQYYINRDFDKKYSGCGSLFVDTDSDVAYSDNVIIYGHNMESGKMFHDLLKYDDEDFYKEHKYITFDTIYGDGKYEIIACIRSQIYPEDSDEFKYYNFFNANKIQEYDDYVKNVKALTPYEITASASYGEQLITLSTCAYHTKDGRMVVIAKKTDT